VATSVLMYEGNGKWQEYAGGYSDMLAQRGEGVAMRKAKIEATAKVQKADAVSQTQAQAKKKLSFKEKHALETLPAKIQALQDELKRLEIQLADTNLFSRDPKKFEKSSNRHSVASAELAAAEEQWLELELLRESLEV
jgi:ABC transport system ATP-binding/permease protein